jgi:hypothetical protein
VADPHAGGQCPDSRDRQRISTSYKLIGMVACVGRSLQAIKDFPISVSTETATVRAGASACRSPPAGLLPAVCHPNLGLAT